MITGLLALVEGFGIPSWLVKPLLAVVGALLLLAVLWGAKCTYDKHLIANHDNAQAAVTATADKQADDNAANSRVTDVTREQNEATQTQEAINAAKRSGADPRAAYYRCVQLEQSARHAGKPSPVC